MAHRSALRSVAMLSLVFACAGCGANPNGPAEPEYHSIESFSEPSVQEVVSRMAGMRTLFVFDIDNTLLKFPEGRFVGSDQWYRWQEGLPDSSPRKIHCVLDMQSIAYKLQKLVATDDGNSTRLVRKLQSNGFDVLALTARSSDVRFATERELSRNGFDFSRSGPGELLGLLGTYRPGPSPDLPHPRPASYQDGIAMLAGQDKGVMLRDLLSRLDAIKSYDYVVFFDDMQENVEAVGRALSSGSITPVLFRYVGVDTDVHQYDMREVDQDSDVLLRVFDIFGRRNECDHSDKVGR
jgi:hypothetical protein